MFVGKSLRVSVSLFCILLFFGCNGNGHTITVCYDHIDGLEKSGRVMFESQEIGTVGDVSYTKEGRYEVRLVIMPAFSNVLTEQARFLIVPDPAARKKKAVAVILLETGGKPLPRHATVQGTSEFQAYSEKFKKDLEKGLDYLKEEYGQLADELRNLPTEQKFRVLRDELIQLLEEMKKYGDAAREKLRSEVLPRLEKELERLKEELDTLGREKEAAPQEEKVREIREI